MPVSKEKLYEWHDAMTNMVLVSANKSGGVPPTILAFLIPPEKLEDLRNGKPEPLSEFMVAKTLYIDESNFVEGLVPILFAIKNTVEHVLALATMMDPSLNRIYRDLIKEHGSDGVISIMKDVFNTDLPEGETVNSILFKLVPKVSRYISKELSARAAIQMGMYSGAKLLDDVLKMEEQAKEEANTARRMELQKLVKLRVEEMLREKDKVEFETIFMSSFRSYSPRAMRVISATVTSMTAEDDSRFVSFDRERVEELEVDDDINRPYYEAYFSGVPSLKAL